MSKIGANDVVHKGTEASSVTVQKICVGLVSSFVSGESNVVSHAQLAPAHVIRETEAGLPVQELDDLQSSLGLSMDKLLSMLGISKATFHRRKAAGRLDASESDRVVRFARLMGQAVRVLESEWAARLWLNSPQVGLGGSVPLQYSRTEVGAREVENLLGRIEYGVYS